MTSVHQQQISRETNHENIGISAWTGYGGNVDGFCRLARSVGASHIELRQFIGGDDKVDTSGRKAIRQALEAAGLRSSVHAPWKLNLASSDRNSRRFALDQYKKLLDLAAELGSEVMVFHGGWNEDRAGGHELVNDAAHELVKHAATMVCRPALENDEVSRPTLFHNPEDFRSIKVDGLAYVLDIGHANTLGHSVQEFAKVMRSRVVEVHLHDNDGTGDQHLSLGRGTVNWSESIPQVLATEPHLLMLECYSDDDITASMKRLRQLLRVEGNHERVHT